MKVMKFGGTSVGSAARIKDVATLIGRRGKNVIVLSAMSGTTNSLLSISEKLRQGDAAGAERLTDELAEKYAEVLAELFGQENSGAEGASEALNHIFSKLRSIVDLKEWTIHSEREIVACGELMSTNLLFHYMKGRGYAPVLLPALEFMRLDDQGEPDLEYLETHLNPMLLENGDAAVYITQGFICRDHQGKTANLERGGSDYTASLIGAAIEAEEVEIWTDIDGMHNNDPRFVEGTSPVRTLNFDEAAELAYFGAKILHPTCIQPARARNIPVRLLNTMDPSAEGTLIFNTEPDRKIKAVAAKDNITAIRIKSTRMLLAYGFLRRVFEVFEKFRTPIDMITTSEVGVSLTIDSTCHLDEILSELQEFGTVSVDKDMVIICVVGDLQWANKGFEADVVEALRDIPVRMISYGGSNRNISLLVKKDDKVKALQRLSEKLF